MRAARMGWIALALAGCSRPSDKPAETADAQVTSMADAAPATAVTLVDFAGIWDVRAALRDDPSKSVTYELKAAADPSAWTVTFPDGDPIPLRNVAVEGDSVVSEAGPFPDFSLYVRSPCPIAGDRSDSGDTGRSGSEPRQTAPGLLTCAS